ncbi:MAG: hypothetical protein IJO74_02375 [Clostridia bacterium]|nr:hypothetical protein [Clostridia bacterium]
MSGLLEKGGKYYFKIIDRFEFNFVFENCPVQIVSGMTVSDIQTNKLFLSLSYLNVGEKAIKGLGVQILFYNGTRVNYILPDAKKEYYIDLEKAPPTVFVADKKPEKHKKSAEKDSVFGNDYYIELDDSYFKKIETGITKIVFADGTEESYTAVSRSEYDSFSTLKKEELSAYKDINIYRSAEEKYPAKVIPAQSEIAWVCCCGAKNSNDLKKCAVCDRDKEWQFENLTVRNLEKVAQDYNNSEQAIRRKASEIRAEVYHKTNLTKEQQAEKDKRDREALERAVKQQQRSERIKKRVIALVLFWLIVMAVYVVIRQQF